MRSLCIVGISMLICFAHVATPLPTISFNIPTISHLLVRPSYTMMFHVVHIATTCLLGLLFIETYHELKKVKTDMAQEKTKLKKEKSYVTQSQFQDRFENEINEGIELKMDTVARQAGRHFTPAGDGKAIKEQLQECYKYLSLLEKRIEVLEQTIKK